MFCKRLFLVILLSAFNLAYAELVAVSDVELTDISGQSGITLNAKVVLGAESNFVYTNTSGKTEADASAAEKTYLIVSGIEGSLEFEGLKLDLIADLNNSGKSAFQWTLPSKLVATELKTSGIYASTTKEVDTTETAGVVPSTFITSVNMNGTLLLPAETKISVFVVN